MTIRNRIFENFGLRHYTTLIGKRNTLKKRLERLKIYFPERITNLEKELEFLTDEEITGLENNTPIRYVSPGIYIKEIDYAHVPNHNIENIEDYINERGLVAGNPPTISDLYLSEARQRISERETISMQDTVNMLR